MKTIVVIFVSAVVIVVCLFFLQHNEEIVCFHKSRSVFIVTNSIPEEFLGVEDSMNVSGLDFMFTVEKNEAFVEDGNAYTLKMRVYGSSDKKLSKQGFDHVCDFLHEYALMHRLGSVTIPLDSQSGVGEQSLVPQ